MNLIVGSLIAFLVMSVVSTAAIALLVVLPHRRNTESDFARRARLDRERGASLIRRE